MKPALITLAMLLTGAAAPDAAPAYKLAKSVALGAPDRWDYVVFSADTGQVYIAHGDRLTVVDGASGVITGEVTDIPGGTHGTAISLATGQGFTDDGDGAKAIAFDLKTLKITRRIPTGEDADGIAINKATGHVFVVDGEPGQITVIDPKRDTVIATISAGEKIEYIVSDDHGAVYAAGEDKSDLIKIDARSNRIVARWATPGCVKPHGMAIDTANHRLFMGCVNNLMVVVDSRNGHVVARLPIGAGSDAVAFDAKRARVFSANGRDGTISVYQQTTPDSYQAMAPIITQVSGKTMSLDPESGRLFVAAADTDPATTPGGRPRPRPGTLRLLMFDPS